MCIDSASSIICSYINLGDNNHSNDGISIYESNSGTIERISSS